MFLPLNDNTLQRLLNCGTLDLAIAGTREEMLERNELPASDNHVALPECRKLLLKRIGKRWSAISNFHPAQFPFSEGMVLSRWIKCRKSNRKEVESELTITRNVVCGDYVLTVESCRLHGGRGGVLSIKAAYLPDNECRNSPQPIFFFPEDGEAQAVEVLKGLLSLAEGITDLNRRASAATNRPNSIEFPF